MVTISVTKNINHSSYKKVRPQAFITPLYNPLIGYYIHNIWFLYLYKIIRKIVLVMGKN